MEQILHSIEYAVLYLALGFFVIMLCKFISTVNQAMSGGADSDISMPTEDHIVPEPPKEDNVPNSTSGPSISHFNGKINWDVAQDAGFDFLMIRMGSGSVDGETFTLDECFKNNVDGASLCGLDCGCYWVSRAKTLPSFAKEVSYVVGLLSKYPATFSYPIAMKFSHESADVDKELLTKMVLYYASALAKENYMPMLKVNVQFLAEHLVNAKLDCIDKWLVNYDDTPFLGTRGMEQISGSGRCDGIPNIVAVNVSYYDYPATIIENQLNGFFDSDDDMENMMERIKKDEK